MYGNNAFGRDGVIAVLFVIVVCAGVRNKRDERKVGRVGMCKWSASTVVPADRKESSASTFAVRRRESEPILKKNLSALHRRHF